MATWRLTVWTRFSATADEVWRVKTDLAVLQGEFGPLIRVATADPEGLQHAIRQTGRATFGLRLTGPLGLVGWEWPGEIVESDPPRLFRDTSVSPLFSAWDHRHRVEEVGSGARYVDDVTFTPRVRPGRVVAVMTRALFIHRHRRAAQHLPADGPAPGHVWLRRETPRLR